jgi:hypothetical protein
VLAALVTACGGGGGTSRLLISLERIPARPLLLKLVTVRDTEAIAASLASAESSPQAKTALTELWRSASDPERMTRVAFCSGIDQLAEYADSDPETYFTAESWRAFMIDVVTNWSLDVIGTKVSAVDAANTIDDFMNGFELAQVDATAAQLYLRACVV